ncbi:hypothetical protein T03_5428 [Trichinella britovi]|uniref:Uncharacterized protein n=1 Tax=Trichinella britovi TaxID=45882 RepID=A0A0V1CSP5_TRIBR|nr:hypothetical protein T03_5428 [Trichinella britovi]
MASLRSQSQDREEEIDKKRELEKNFDRFPHHRPSLRLEELEVEVEKRSTGVEKRLGEDKRGHDKDKPQAIFQDLDLPPG